MFSKRQRNRRVAPGCDFCRMEIDWGRRRASTGSSGVAAKNQKKKKKRRRGNVDVKHSKVPGLARARKYRAGVPFPSSLLRPVFFSVRLTFIFPSRLSFATFSPSVKGKVV